MGAARFRTSSGRYIVRRGERWRDREAQGRTLPIHARPGVEALYPASMPPKKPKGPEFLRYVAPIVTTLVDLGSSGTASEVTDRVIERLKLSAAEQDATTSNGQSRARNQIAWARFYLEPVEPGGGGVDDAVGRIVEPASRP